MLFFLSNMLLSFAAAISPGPNIILVTSNSIVYGKRAGLATAAGAIVGVMFWMALLAFGFSYFLNNKTVLTIFHAFAAIYLTYLSYVIYNMKILPENMEAKSKGKFFSESLIATFLNPEIAIFYGSIFIRVIERYNLHPTSQLMIHILGFLTVETFVFFTAALAFSKVRHLIFAYVRKIRIAAAAIILFYGLMMGYKLIF